MCSLVNINRFATTVIGIVAVDLLTGVLAGIGLSLARILYDMANLEIEMDVSEDGNRYDMRLIGSATVVSLPKLAETLEGLPDHVELHAYLNDLDYIDHACLDLLVNWEKQHEAMGGSLSIDWEGLQARFGKRETAPKTQSA